MEKLKCATHSGPFHADDVLAAVLLKFKGYITDFNDVIRSRDAAILDRCDILFDVGGSYDPDKKRFDHHQVGGRDIKAADGHMLSSAGMVFEHILGNWDSRIGRLVRQIDMCDTGEALGESPMSITISEFNPCWDEDCSNEAYNAAFVKACEWLETTITGFEEPCCDLMGHVMIIGNNRQKHNQAVFKARDIVLKAPIIDGVLVLEPFAPWQEHILIRPDWDEVKFVVFPSNGIWMVFQKPSKTDPSKSELPLPAAWAGLRDEKLQEQTGIPDAVFVHIGRFCGGAETKEGALAMAKLAQS